ncbi:MAG: trypsin-like serine peptidase, partial [Casimicrobiaceae bacterium]
MLAIACPRGIPANARRIALDTLTWTTLADGIRAAQVVITSPGALAMRVALGVDATDPGVSLRFAGVGDPRAIFGPIPASSVAAATTRFGRYWTPVLTGSRATIEIAVEPGASIAGIALRISGVSHQVVAPSHLGKLSAKDLLQIGAADGCEIDLACVTPPSQALNEAAAAVAELDVTQDDGYSYLCTGQFLNDSISSGTPYFFTANHCIDSAYAAQTLNTYWFFQAASCGSASTPAYVQLAAGAMLLGRSEDFDWALVRLNEDPPQGARFAAWRAEPIPALTPISVLHHPEGDLLKWSEGATQGYNQYSDGSSFAVAGYDQGTTEPGSSGAGLLTWFPSGGYYEVRGGLFQGDASCRNPQGTDDYSRLDDMLPLMRQYLTPGTLPGTDEAVVVEFYNATLQHYFMTTNPPEINDLDTGVHPGWERTGLRFLAYSASVAGANPVCRFY